MSVEIKPRIVQQGAPVNDAGTYTFRSHPTSSSAVSYLHSAQNSGYRMRTVSARTLVRVSIPQMGQGRKRKFFIVFKTAPSAIKDFCLCSQFKVIH